MPFISNYPRNSELAGYQVLYKTLYFFGIIRESVKFTFIFRSETDNEKRTMASGHAELEVDLTDLLECEICSFRMNGTVHKCSNWHLMCEECFVRHENASDVNPDCPQCRVQMWRDDTSKVHNVLLEKLPKLPCSNEGCPVQMTDVDRLQLHREEDCGYRMLQCPWHECQEVRAANQMKAHLECQHPGNRGFYSNNMTVTMDKAAVLKNAGTVNLAFTDEDGYSNLKNYTLKTAIQMPVPPPRDRRAPTVVAWVVDKSITHEQESAMEFRLKVESENHTVLLPSCHSRCVAVGADTVPPMRFPLWDFASEGYTGDLLMTVAVREASSNVFDYSDGEASDGEASDGEASETGSVASSLAIDYDIDYEVLGVMTSGDSEDDDDETEEADTTLMSPLQIDIQGIASSRTT